MRLARLQFLQADSIRPGNRQPLQEVGKATIDVIDVEGGDLQQYLLARGNG
jgi:hypothetical protein